MVSLRPIRGSLLLALAAFLLTCGAARATDIYSTTLSIPTTAPTQFGRLLRSGVPSRWSTQKPFPGVIDAVIAYHFTTLDLDVAALEASYSYSPYLQITFASPYATTFLSAYSGSFSPLDLASNYLGDEGTSGDSPGGARVFQLVVPRDTHLVLVLNESFPYGGVGLPGNVLIQAFADTNDDDLSVAPVPEPATWSLVAPGLALLVIARSKKKVANCQAA